MASQRKYSNIVVRKNGYCELIIIRISDGETWKHLFDEEHHDYVVGKQWHQNFHQSGYANYAISGVKTGGMRLHWIPFGRQPGCGQREGVIDHIDGNPFDSRKQNLQILTNRDNTRKRRNASIHGSGVMVDSNGHYRTQVITDSCRTLGREKSGNLKYTFQPSFKALSSAQACAEAFTEIGEAVSAGLRQPPSKEELKTIADSFR